jgi:hypothetical protein
MAGSAAVDRRTASFGILSDIRSDRLLSQFHDKVGSVVAFIGTQRDGLRAIDVRLDQRPRVVTAPTIR